jgi:transcriptional regulator with XRE-family HTH domain
MSTLSDWVPSTDDFASRLVLVRHQMGWNLKEAALACGVKAQSWREWELENRKPRDYEGICRQIATRSGCNLIWLMTGISSPRPPDDGGPGADKPVGYRAWWRRPAPIIELLPTG